MAEMSEDEDQTEKGQGSGGLSRREMLKGAGLLTLGVVAGTGRGEAQTVSAQVAMMDFAAPALTTVRLGFIGVGARGSSHIGVLLTIEGVSIKAICDPHLPSIQNALQIIGKAGRPAPETYSNGQKDYLRLLERDDLDAVVISTPWNLHTPMAVAAMQVGKHVFVEVPAAKTLEQCWQLVQTAESTRRHCMMLENVCYGFEEMAILHMCQQNVFGELLHGEAAYIHDLRFQMQDVDHGTGSWRTLEYVGRNGNLYPTHGLGPIAQYMGINRGDRFSHLTSMSSPAKSRGLYAQNLPAGNPHRLLRFNAGDVNTSIIQTGLGRTIMLQWDEQTPRPYSRLNQIVGSRGTFAGFPNRIYFDQPGQQNHEWATVEETQAVLNRYEHPLYKTFRKTGLALQGHGGMDTVMWWRIITCLRNGWPIDQSVYDAAAWTAVGPMSERSVATRGRTVDIPDFTRGLWKKTPPLDIRT